MAESFSFLQAFDRNIGWLTEWEQLALKGKRVAIAGMGGVGGFHLLTLARLGVGAFSIADLDSFELANFNRQVGASMASLGRPKVDVLAEMALSINPELEIRRFPEGVQPDHIDDFLAGADLFIDGFDFFVLDIRRQVFRRCAQLAIPVLTAAPVGMGVGLVGFTRDGMDFEDYFRFEGQSELRQYVHFLLGVAPSGIHRSYLVDPTRLDFARKKAPSTIIGVQLAASATAAAAVKLLLGRKGFEPAPHHHHYDAFLGRLVKTRLRWGNAGPLQRLKARLAEKSFRALAGRPARPELRYPANRMEAIIDLARWTPSGDNSQPWRFLIGADESLDIFIKDDSGRNIYEFDNGRPTLLSSGMLLASLEIAASAYHLRMEWRYEGKVGRWYQIKVRFLDDAAIERDPLWSAVPLRSVDRRPYRKRLLTAGEKAALTDALSSGLEIVWFENGPGKRSMADLNSIATDIRLRIPETYEIHKHAIAWNSRRSPDRIPAAALGLDRATLSIMCWAMADRTRLDRLNRLFGTGITRFQMDYLPGLYCAAHFSIQFPTAGMEKDPIELVRAGHALQRFWLMATRLGLVLQPSLAPLAFLYLAQSSSRFTSDIRMQNAAQKLVQRARIILPESGARTIFLGRIGEAVNQQASRSTRLPLETLILTSPPAD